MASWCFLCVSCVLCLLCFPATGEHAAHAQDSPRGTSLAYVIEAIDRARNTTRVLYVIAHPDDEGGGVGLLAYLSRGLGAEVALLALTRGEGGQNAIGPEHGPKLGILRTAELEAACRRYGVRLYFTRAPDFGYSKTVEETLRIWGDGVREDMARVIEHFRPHFVINHWAGSRGGHGHHQASGVLTAEVYAEFERGVRNWQPTALLNIVRGEAAGWRVPSDEISPLWGKTYNEIGLEGFVQHRTQGIAGFRGSPFFRRRAALAAASGEFGPEMLHRSVAQLAATHPRFQPRLPEVDRALAAAGQAALRLDSAAAVRALAAAGRALDATIALFEVGPDGGAEFSDAAEERLHWEFVRARARIHRALVLAAGLQVEALADRSELVAGEDFTVTLAWLHRAEPGIAVRGPRLLLPEGWSASEGEAPRDGIARFAVRIPAAATPPEGRDAWMHPWPEPVVSASLSVAWEDYEFEVAAPVVHQRVTSTRAETAPLELVPAVTVTLEPKQFVVRRQQPPAELELVARVHYYGTRPAEVTAALDAPTGWEAPAPAMLRFAGPGDELVRFVVGPPERPAAGSNEFVARAQMDGQRFSTAVEPLPSLPTRLWREPAAAAVHVFDVEVPEGLRVGYVAAANDPLPAALAQLGIRVELLDELALAFGDLSRFDAIAIGIRAYELREDLARSNRRLLEYVETGGTLVVQYQRENVWNALRPAPYPAEVGGGIGSDRARVSDETAPVRLLVPEHMLFTFPNRITTADFDGWVQERGLYFWVRWDEQYTPLAAMADPGEAETNGALLIARHGRGAYIYTGLAFFRQLPAGVPGAWRLFVNLLSPSRAPH